MAFWGVDTILDARIRAEVGLKRPSPYISYGVRGHGGHFSFLTPRAQSRHHRWQCSSHLTALHSIAAVALANTLMMSPGYDEVRNVCSSLVTHFSSGRQKLPLPQFTNAALGFFSASSPFAQKVPLQSRSQFVLDAWQYAEEEKETHLPQLLSLHA